MSRFSTGVQLKRQHEPNYGRIASCSIFAKACNDESEEEDLRAGKINYVALGERDRTSDDFFVEEEVDDQEAELQDDYDKHFDGIQERRRMTFQGDKGNVKLFDIEISEIYAEHKRGRREEKTRANHQLRENSGKTNEERRKRV